MAVVRKEEAFGLGRIGDGIAEDKHVAEITEAQIQALVQTAMRILGARSLLFVALVGSIAIAYLTLQSQDSTAIYKFVSFTLTVFCPTVWLSTKRAV